MTINGAMTIAAAMGNAPMKMSRNVIDGSFKDPMMTKQAMPSGGVSRPIGVYLARQERYDHGYESDIGASCAIGPC